MARLLIVYHSMTGGTAAMAEAARDGARAAIDADDDVRLIRANDAGSADLLEAEGYLFACPENLAAIAGVMKDFFDRCYYPALGRIEGRAYAQMICAGSDGTNAARQIARIATGWRLKEVAPPLIVITNAQTPEEILTPKTINAADLDQCRDLGATLAAGLAIGVF